jgi:hypothetical protein
LGPEHEFSVVNDELKPLPIVDKIIKDFHGRIVNFVEQPCFTFGKELQMHVMEIKPNEPFRSPIEFEETMHQAVLTMHDFLQRKYRASFLGTGMHPLLGLGETGVWPHRDRKFYQAMNRVFDLKQHGWLNIQGFQLNLPYSNERKGVLLHNHLANVCAYLPAIAASSPIYEGHFGKDVDNRLHFYALNQKEVPSITGEVVPEYVSSFLQYRQEIIGRFSSDLVRAGADSVIVNREWINSRGVIFRFDRRALEIRVMDEQECIKSDVALSCFIRALARGLMTEEAEFLSQEVLVKDYNATVRDGFDARVQHPRSPTARQVCKSFLRVAGENATEEEEKYLPLIEKRIQHGSLSEVVRERVKSRSQKTDFRDAVVDVYSKLIRSLINNEPYF